MQRSVWRASNRRGRTKSNVCLTGKQYIALYLIATTLQQCLSLYLSLSHKVRKPHRHLRCCTQLSPAVGLSPPPPLPPCFSMLQNLYCGLRAITAQRTREISTALHTHTPGPPPPSLSLLSPTTRVYKERKRRALSNMTEAIGPEPCRRSHAAAWFFLFCFFFPSLYTSYCTISFFEIWYQIRLFRSQIPKTIRTKHTSINTWNM